MNNQEFYLKNASVFAKYFEEGNYLQLCRINLNKVRETIADKSTFNINNYMKKELYKALIIEQERLLSIIGKDSYCITKEELLAAIDFDKKDVLENDKNIDQEIKLMQEININLKDCIESIS